VEVLPAPAIGQRACRLVSKVLGFDIAISGLSAVELAYRLEGEGEPWRWRDLVGRGPITVELQSPERSTTADGAGTVFERELEDGRVRLISGGSAQFEVEGRHIDAGAILPYCFHAALAQQLALAGVLTFHAAGIVTNQGGLLTVGRKGAGKSTLAASALLAGFGLISDDWLLAGFDGPVLHVERMRNFMMLRKGWASEQLKERMSAGMLHESKARPRYHLPLPQGDSRFPPHAQLDKICVIERPRGGRRAHTDIQPLAPAQALAHLTESSMPVVLSRQLPVERACVFAHLSRALSHAPAHRISAGTDLVSTPETAWRGMLEALADPCGQARPAVDRG
jgi:hypothetical protein